MHHSFKTNALLFRMMVLWKFRTCNNTFRISQSASFTVEAFFSFLIETVQLNYSSEKRDDCIQLAEFTRWYLLPFRHRNTQIAHHQRFSSVVFYTSLIHSYFVIPCNAAYIYYCRKYRDFLNQQVYCAYFFFLIWIFLRNLTFWEMQISIFILNRTSNNT